MKFRLGFVSNSSSSSFILAIKGELTKRKLKSSPMYGLAKEISECFCESPEPVNDDPDYWDNRDLTKFAALREKGFTVYHAVASDNDNPMECYLREQGFSVNTDKLFVEVNN